jgi:alanine racemase
MMNPPIPLPTGVHRPTLAIIDLDALAHNLGEIRKRLPLRTAVCAVVKADAYGHGAVPVSRELESLGVESFVVATVEEGVELREAGIRRPVLVLGVGESGADVALEQGLTPVIYSRESAGRIAEAACKTGRDIPVHIKLDTGMGRVGLLEDEWLPVAEDLLENTPIRLEGILTHFSSAESDPEFTRTQTDRFRSALNRMPRVSACGPALVHMANSSGILNGQEFMGNMVRPGIILYGAYPARGYRETISLRPVMTLQTRVLHVKSLPPGSPVSYGQTFRTTRSSRIATLPVGYADGYRRDLSNRGWVLIHGRTAQVAGTVTMDLTMVDVTDLPETREGDEVVLFGGTGEAVLRVDDLAEKIGTIPYELLCGVSRRVPRVYRRSGRGFDAPGSDE